MSVLFKVLLTKDQQDAEVERSAQQLLRNIPKLITPQQNEELVRIVTLEEVREAVFWMEKVLQGWMAFRGSSTVIVGTW